MTATTALAADTRARLLEAAGQVFSEAGFRAATVREIVRRAGAANFAAVNYHFRDKAGLYAAVLEQSAREAVAQYPPDAGLRPGASAEEHLQAFVRAFLQRILDRGRHSVHGRLMAREMVEPTRALGRIVEQVIRPMYGRLCGIVKELAAPRATLAQVEASAKSIVGQCLFYKHCSPVLEHLEGRPPDARNVEALCAHIVSFSLGALRSLPAPRRKGGRR